MGPMMEAWRWKKELLKRTVFDTLLDKVVRDLFGGSHRSKPQRLGGRPPQAKSRRQNFSLEAIEPRLLLSADLSYASGNHDFTLKADSATTISLFDNVGNANVDTKALSAGEAITIARGG